MASREVNTLDSVVLSVTRIQGGNTGTCCRKAWSSKEPCVPTAARCSSGSRRGSATLPPSFASAFGAQIDVFWYAGPTALVNDPRWAAFASEVAAQSGYRTRHADLHMGGEDFAVYLQHIPGAFVSIGAAAFGLHHPAYNPDDNLIAPAARYFAALAEQALRQI